MGDHVKRDLWQKLDAVYDEYKSEFSNFNHNLIEYMEKAKNQLAEEQRNALQIFQEMGGNHETDDPLEDEIRMFNMKNLIAKKIENAFITIKEIRSNFTLEQQSTRLQIGLENSTEIMDKNQLKNQLNELTSCLKHKIIEIFGDQVFTEVKIPSNIIHDNLSFGDVYIQKNIPTKVVRTNANHSYSHSIVPFN